MVRRFFARIHQSAASVVALVALTLLGGCATTWMPGPGQSSLNFEPTKARCQLMAMNSGGDFEASGSQNFVIGATIGAAIGEAIRSGMTFNACMRAAGFVEAETQTASAAPANGGKPGVSWFTPLVEERRACVEHVRADPRYSSVVPHLAALETGRFTLQQLADERMPTAEETQAFIAYVDEARPCIEHYRQSIAAKLPNAGPILLEEENNIEALSLQLAHHQLSWGQFDDQQQHMVDAARTQLRQL
jgi:hypothetical protein